MIATLIFIIILYQFYFIYLSLKLDAQTMDYNFEKVVNGTLNDKLEHQRNQIQYDKKIHEFYNKVYDVHNELMKVEDETL